MVRAWTLCYSATVRTEEEKEKEMHALLFPFSFSLMPFLSAELFAYLPPPLFARLTA